MGSVPMKLRIKMLEIGQYFLGEFSFSRTLIKLVGAQAQRGLL